MLLKPGGRRLNAVGERGGCIAHGFGLSSIDVGQSMLNPFHVLLKSASDNVAQFAHLRLPLQQPALMFPKGRLECLASFGRSGDCWPSSDMRRTSDWLRKISIRSSIAYSVLRSISVGNSRTIAQTSPRNVVSKAVARTWVTPPMALTSLSARSCSLSLPFLFVSLSPDTSFRSALAEPSREDSAGVEAAAGSLTNWDERLDTASLIPVTVPMNPRIGTNQINALSSV